jgi:hypothetical protein
VVRQSVPLTDVTIAQDLACGSIRLRKLSPVERGELIEHDMPSPGSRYGHLLSTRWLVAPTIQLEVDTLTTEPRLFATLEPPRVLAALHLHGIKFRGPGVILSQIQPEWFGLGTSSRPFAMRTRVDPTPPKGLTPEEFESVCATARRLAPLHIEEPERPSELALRRFTLGCGREDSADALVDYLVALEALLLPYDDQTRNAELSYRFRLHGAYFLSRDSSERRVVHDQLRSLYGIRSRLVHGGRDPSLTEVNASEALAFELASRGLLRAVTEGFPDAVYFRRVVLEGHP